MAPKKNQNNNGILAGAIVFASVVLGGSLVFFATQLGGTSGNDLQADMRAAIEAYVEEMQNPEPPTVDLSQYDLEDDDAVLGDENAPVTIVEFSDYECPYCKRFYDNTLDLIKKNYVETGKVKIVYRDFPLSNHPGALPAAVAAECAQEQAGDEGYYEYHDWLFDEQDFSEAGLIGQASAMGLDVNEFEACMADEETTAEVANDTIFGRQIGVSGTPAFFVNGKGIEGAQPYAVFESLIEQELAQ